MVGQLVGGRSSVDGCADESGSCCDPHSPVQGWRRGLETGGWQHPSSLFLRPIVRAAMTRRLTRVYGRWGPPRSGVER